MQSAIILTGIGIIVFLILLFRLKPLKINIDDEQPSISIIIPARNEAHRITPTLLSLKPYLNKHQILIVDDHSTDDTRNVCESLGFKVITPLKKPNHVKGKPWALSQGAKHATFDIVLLLDADVIIEKNGIEKLISLYLKENHPISIQPYHAMKHPYEHLSNIFNVLVVMSSLSYTLIPSKQISAFFGPCQIMSKETFMKHGLDPNVTNKVLEDIYLGKSLLQGGHQISSYIGKDIISFRMYPEGIADLLNGFSKNFATGAIAIGIIPSILLIIWLSSLYASLNMIIQSILLNSQITLTAILYFTLGFFLYVKSRYIGNFKLSLIFLYPLYALFFLFTFIWSFLKIYILKKNTWKGRKV